MPSVTLNALWVHEAADPANYVTFDGGYTSVETSKPGERRMYANGTVRSVTRAGHTETMSVVAPFIDRDTLHTLLDWVKAGTLLLLRDVKGRVLWGHIWSLPQTETTTPLVNVSFSFEAITYDESV